VRYSLLAIDFLPPAELAKLLSTVTRKFSMGLLKPMRTLGYSLRSAATAMRALAQASHVGKVLTLSPALGPISGSGGVGRGGKASVAVTGGTGGLGLLVAGWLVKTGAVGKVVLLGRSGRPTGLEGGGGSGNAEAWRALAGSGACTELIAADVACSEDAAAVWGGGRAFDVVLHAAGVLSDAMIGNQSLSHLRR
jgi:hypothetical protein